MISTITQHLRNEMHGKTLVLASIISVVFFLFTGLITNIGLFFSSFSLGSQGWLLAWGLITGIFTTNYWYGTALLILISVLVGINVSLVIARSRRSKEAGATGVGTLFGLVVGGCPSCATGLLPLIGLSLGVGFLPFSGMEFSVLSVIVLIAALYWNATSEVCKVPNKH